MERDEAQAQYQAAQDQIATVTAQYTDSQTALEAMTNERDNLVSYKKGVEDNEKKAVIANYVGFVNAEILEQFTNDLDNYTAAELDIRLTYEQKKAHPEMFTQGVKPAYVPKDDTKKGTLEEILAKYERK
jgi:hypothetical protein